MRSYKRFVLALSVVVLIGLVAAYFLEAQARTVPPERWEDEEYGVVCYMVPGAISCLPIEGELE